MVINYLGNLSASKSSRFHKNLFVSLAYKIIQQIKNDYNEDNVVIRTALEDVARIICVYPLLTHPDIYIYILNFNL